MSIKKYFENRYVRRAFAWALLIAFLMISFITSMDLPFWVDVLIATGFLLLFAAVERKIDQHIEKLNKKLFYQLVEELDIGSINLTDKDSGESIQEIVEQVREHNIEQASFKETLFQAWIGHVAI